LADRSKGIFISNISHELRSPLHGILASAEFLSDTYLSTLQRTFIDSIDTCGRTLLEVINQVLDFGKLTYMARLKGKASRPQIQNSTSIGIVPRLNASTADLIGIVEQTVESCCAVHEFKGISEQVDMGAILGESDAEFREKQFQRRGSGRVQDPSSPLTVIIDVEYRQEGWYFMLQSGAVQRIILNITGNALKYTSAGWVRIQISTKKVQSQTILQITVSDSGKGISAKFQQSRLFNPFAQEDPLQSGTGLGMSIAKQIVQHLGGEIKVSSRVGVGTRVQITLPGDPEMPADSDDPCSRVRSQATAKTVYLAGFGRTTPASRFLYESIANYITCWYQMEIVDDVSFADLIISNECPELLNHFRRTSSSDSQAFILSSAEQSPTSNNVYCAKQPLIVLCSNASQYEFFGSQAEPGKVIDFSSKPCGPYKLARSILFCLEPQKTVGGTYGRADRVET
jgi:signal transduction histidine kinase